MLPEDPTKAITTTIDRTTSATLAARWAYYSGNHPKIYITPKLRETFRDLADSLSENYCGLAVNSRISRMEITGWDGPGADTAEQAWTLGGFPQRQDALYRWGLVHGAVYLVVQDDVIAANPATTTFAMPDPDDWMGVAWAGKLYDDGGKWGLSLWDETTIYRYAGPELQVKDGRVTTPKPDEFTLQDEGSHGYDRVPVFPVNPYGFLGAPLMDQIAPVQDRINKIVANKFVAAEFGAFKQRVFFTQQQLDPYSVRQAPDHAIVLDPGTPDGKASVQELGGTDLGNYDEAKNSEVDALFTIATLPRHMRVNPGTPPSGEAIKADEGPFVEALRDHQREFGEALVRAFALLGVECEPVWRDVEVHDDLANAQVVATLVGAGLPWQVVAARYLGMTPDEIAEAQALAQPQGTGQVQAQADAFLSNPTLTF